MSAQDQFADLLKITSRLIAVLEREIEMLRTMRPSELQDLQQEKIVLTAAYESQAKAMANQPDLLDSVQPALRGELERAMTKFRSALSANERALRAARETTQRVLKAIADEIDRKRRENTGYSADGHVASRAQPSAGDPVSVAVDQRL